MNDDELKARVDERLNPIAVRAIVFFIVALVVALVYELGVLGAISDNGPTGVVVLLGAALGGAGNFLLRLRFANEERPRLEAERTAQRLEDEARRQRLEEQQRNTPPVLNLPAPTPAPVQDSGTVAAESREAAQAYLQYLIDYYRYPSFKGMGVDISLKIPLLNLYVPLKAIAEAPKEDKAARDSGGRGPRMEVAGLPLPEADRKIFEEHPSRAQPLLDLLRRHKGLILLGDPGSGKTTFLRYLALVLATGQSAQVGLEQYRLPIFLPLAVYAEALGRRRTLPLQAFIADYYLEEAGGRYPLGQMMARALADGAALILLDGLDEVRDLGLRHIVVERATQFFAAHQARGNKFVMTSRIVGYSEVRPAVEGLEEAALMDFDDAEIGLFVQQWTTALEEAAIGAARISNRQAAQERAELQRAIYHNAGVRRLAANPLLLTILALMKRQGMTLPERRVELYETYVKALVKSWNSARSSGRKAGLDVNQTVQVLAPLALWMQEQPEGRGLVSETDLITHLTAIMRQRAVAWPDQEAAKFLDDVHAETSILLPRGTRQYGFMHLTFLEYLAAVGIEQATEGQRDAIVAVLSAHLDDPVWHEVILLTIGYIGIIQSRARPASAIVQAILARAAGAPGQAAIVMGEAVADAYPGGVTDSCKSEVVQAVLATMRNPAIPAPQRVAAGNTLAKLGDPRFDPAFWHLPKAEDSGFIEIAAGKFTMGSDTDYDNEKPSHDLPLPRFWLARYPVTVAQWRAYLKATGREARDPDSLSGIANHPVVWVYWEEALQYSEWLDEQLKHIAPERVAGADRDNPLWQGLAQNTLRVILPSEAEWERAARYTDGREYPWNGPLTPDHANYDDTGLGTTSPVGAFPQGLSAEGIEELSGNVWQWTRTMWDQGRFRYPYRTDDGREELQDRTNVPRVLRGGAFDGNDNYVRGAARLRNYPLNGYWYLGFRVAVSTF